MRKRTWMLLFIITTMLVPAIPQGKAQSDWGVVVGQGWTYEHNSTLLISMVVTKLNDSSVVGTKMTYNNATGYTLVETNQILSYYYVFKVGAKPPYYSGPYYGNATYGGQMREYARFSYYWEAYSRYARLYIDTTTGILLESYGPYLYYVTLISWSYLDQGSTAIVIGIAVVGVIAAVVIIFYLRKSKL